MGCPAFTDDIRLSNLEVKRLILTTLLHTTSWTANWTPRLAIDAKDLKKLLEVENVIQKDF